MEIYHDADQVFSFLASPRFAFTAKLLDHFPESEIFLVGGAVRDSLRGKTPQEFDFVVRGVPAEELEKFLAQLGHVDFVGKVFSVFKFRPLDQDQSYDIALPRTDYAWGTGGHRDVAVQSDHLLPIERDLERRDFTVNAMAVKLIFEQRDLKSEILHLKPEIIDPFHGLADLEEKIIRTVGEPKERFQEDYARMLRALRFACQLGFEIEKSTWSALTDMMPGINDIQGIERLIPYEIIAKEFLKSLVSDPRRMLDIWDRSGALRELIPELLLMKNCPQPHEWHSEGDVWTHTRLCFEKLFSEGFEKEFSPSLLTPPEQKIESNILITEREHTDVRSEDCLSEVRRASVVPVLDASRAGNDASSGREFHSKNINMLERLPSSAAKKEFPSAVPSINLLLAILFHDIGKPATLKTPEIDGVDRIRFDEHDTIGAKMFRTISDRLKLSAPEKLRCDPEEIAWIISHHMLLVHAKVDQLKNTTIEKYFFDERVPGDDLRKLFWVDARASVPADGGDTLVNFHALKDRLAQLAKDRGPRLPPALLSGDEIMELLGIPAGKRVGELKESLREEQLKEAVSSKKDAINYIKTLHSSAMSD